MPTLPPEICSPGVRLVSSRSVRFNVAFGARPMDHLVPSSLLSQLFEMISMNRNRFILVCSFVSVSFSVFVFLIGHRVPAGSREEAGHRGRQAATAHAKPRAVHACRGQPRHVQPDPTLQLSSLPAAEFAGMNQGAPLVLWNKCMRALASGTTAAAVEGRSLLQPNSQVLGEEN